MTVSTPLRGTSRLTVSTRNPPRPAVAAPAPGVKCSTSTPQGTTVTCSAGTPSASELVDLVAARRQHPVDRRAEVALGRDPAGRARVVGALVAALDRTERVEGLHDRHAEGPGRGQGRQPRHPEVGVDDVGPLRAPAGGQVGREGVHVVDAARPSAARPAGRRRRGRPRHRPPSAPAAACAGRCGGCGRRPRARRRPAPARARAPRRSGHRRRPRRGRSTPPAGWRARRPSRSACAHSSHDPRAGWSRRRSGGADGRRGGHDRQVPVKGGRGQPAGWSRPGPRARAASSSTPPGPPSTISSSSRSQSERKRSTPWRARAEARPAAPAARARSGSSR